MRVNGAVARLGDQADPASDRMELDGQPAGCCRPPPSLCCSTSPAGVICSCHDPAGPPHGAGSAAAGAEPGDRPASGGPARCRQPGRPAAQQRRCPHPAPHPSPLRPPQDTTGCGCRGEPRPAALEQWRRGVPLDGQPSQPVEVRRAARSGAAAPCWSWRCGRAGTARSGAPPSCWATRCCDLQRVAIGPVRLGDLPEGRWRHLDPREWEHLVRARLSPAPIDPCPIDAASTDPRLLPPPAGVAGPGSAVRQPAGRAARGSPAARRPAAARSSGRARGLSLRQLAIETRDQHPGARGPGAGLARPAAGAGLPAHHAAAAGAAPGSVPPAASKGRCRRSETPARSAAGQAGPAVTLHPGLDRCLHHLAGHRALRGADRWR